jgi:hypothetical protein
MSSHATHAHEQELRASLILSILVQLLDDKSPLVRAAVARNLGILISCLDENEANKYQQIQELLFRLLKDGDPSVVQMTQVCSSLPFLHLWSRSFHVTPACGLTDSCAWNRTQDIFLPMLVDWADTLDLMSSHLLTTLLAQIQNFSEVRRGISLTAHTHSHVEH